MPHRLQALRERLVSAADLGEPSDYFVDHLLPDPAFMSEGSQAENPTLRMVLETAASSCLRTQIRLTGFDPIHVQRGHFWHGALIFERHLGAFFYFDDIDVGLAGISSVTSLMSTLFIRFSLTPVAGPGPSFPSSGPRGQS